MAHLVDRFCIALKVIKWNSYVLWWIKVNKNAEQRKQNKANCKKRWSVADMKVLKALKTILHFIYACIYMY